MDYILTTIKKQNYQLIVMKDITIGTSLLLVGKLIMSCNPFNNIM